MSSAVANLSLLGGVVATFTPRPHYQTLTGDPLLSNLGARGSVRPAFTTAKVPRLASR